MSTTAKVFITILSVVLIAAIVFFGFTPVGRGVFSRYEHDLTKEEQDNNYANRKAVEDSARATLTDYNRNLALYNQYKDDESDFGKQMAAAYKTQAITDATKYNDYITKNRYLWKDNLPPDLPNFLPLPE